VGIAARRPTTFFNEGVSDLLFDLPAARHVLGVRQTKWQRSFLGQPSDQVVCIAGRKIGQCPKWRLPVVMCQIIRNHRCAEEERNLAI
jgi:hypothetical protein